MTREPLRWSDPSSDAPGALRGLLDSVVVDEATNAQLDRVASGLAAKLGIPAPSATTATHATQAAGVATVAKTGLATKLVLGIALVAMVATGVGVWLPRGESAQPAAAPVIAPVAPEAVAVSAVEVTQSVEQPPAPVAPAIETRRPPAQPPETATAAPRAEDEVAILKAAQAALASDPAGALVLAERHAAQFTASVLREEREAIAIEALVGLDRLGQARTRFEQFVASFPRSGYRARLARRLERR